MRRKIAAILVAHIADYGRLVADDEEETLRRMASCRTTIDDFIAIAGGRIFNTAGDAVLAEFPSAVEAVRCAIDIQESLRTRNLAYPASRQMSYRIGIGIGDVVEREGDLLGDGVNIAARLEGLAEVGGICISRAVHEQVAGKLSARFIDIGARKVKNIPAPVHAYVVSIGCRGANGYLAHPTPASSWQPFSTSLPAE
jgi:class 3 adenylate cyclase